MVLGLNIHIPPVIPEDMKLGRIIHQNKELYVIAREQSLVVLDTKRNDSGIEEFLSTGQFRESDQTIPMDNNDFEWLPPLHRPGKILCVGRNYAEHAREQGKEPESKPLIFSKFSTSMVGHSSGVEFPLHTEYLDYEVELAIIIGREAKQLNEQDKASDYIFGYTIANDLTARDVQKSEKQWTRAKGFDASLPIGPLLVTQDEVGIPESNEIWLTVNGENRQQSKLSHMIFGIEFLVKYISQTITLEPGDIILTGTPEGVGYYMDPRKTLQKGDHIACGVTGIGELRFSVS